MGEISLWRRIKDFFTLPCWIKGHSYKYEPMPGDEPPFEFMYCSVCVEPNPNMLNIEDI